MNMKAIFIDKLKITHIVFGLMCCIFIVWIMKPHYLLPTSTWQPKASYIYNQKLSETASYVKGGAIPMIIHQTWRNYNVPEMTIPWVKKCAALHADYEYWFWTDSDIEKLITELYPQHLHLFNNYPASVYRADAFRYFVLFEYGGIYMDLDMECTQSLSTIRQSHECFLSQEPVEHAHFLSPMGIPLVSNALMGCRRGHPFFKHVIEDLHSHSGWYVWNDVLQATGPYMLTEEYRYYVRDGLFFSSLAKTNELYLAPPEVFHPTTDPSMRDHMRSACINSQGHTFLNNQKYFERQQQLCTRILQDGFREGPTSSSITNHHWTHSWAGLRNDPYNIIGTNVYIDVRTVFTDSPSA